MEIRLEKYNEVFNKIYCEPSISYELKDYFSFRVPGCEFVPAYRNKMWDGNIYLYNPLTCLLYGGLNNHLQEFCKERKYSLISDDSFKHNEFSLQEANQFFSSLNLPFPPRDYQTESFLTCVRENRKLILSPTGCHKKDDLVLKSDGTYIKVQNIKVGDMLAGPDGLPKKVTKLFNGVDDLYEIIPNGNRRKITVNSEHILPLKFSDSKSKYGYCKGNKDYIENISVKEYLKKSNYYKHCAKLFYNETPIETKNQKLPRELSPYFIGLYIGDGSTHICQAIFDSSIADRFEFLAGIIDSYGYLNSSKTYFELVFKSKILAEDVERLAITLGLITSFRLKYNKKYDRNYYKITILGNIHKIPTRLERKQASSHTRQQNRYKCGFKVNHIGCGEFYGFEVEDSLYITHSGMVTHNSGKSLLLYLITRYYDSKTLIIVPTTSLIHQLSSDFISYGLDENHHIHKIFQGQDKTSDAKIFIATWQSLYKQPKKWFEQFNVVIGDEAHLFKAKSLTTIMSNLENCKYRFGFTGTLDGTNTHKLMLEALFGSVKKTVSTNELITNKVLSDFKIKSLILNYPDEVKKMVSKLSYQEEMDFLVSNKSRNNFIKNLTLSLKGNSLLLFQYVEKHGNILYNIIKEQEPNRKVYFIHGGIDGEERERIRKIVDKSNNSIIVASYQTFSTGINIKNLHNVIFSSPSKSKIRNLQSIGRGLRKSDSKDIAVLYDIADDLSWKSKKNYTMLHYIERMKTYNEEKFQYQIYNINLKT